MQRDKRDLCEKQDGPDGGGLEARTLSLAFPACLAGADIGDYSRNIISNAGTFMVLHGCLFEV
jgi:hypothetical protein